MKRNIKATVEFSNKKVFLVLLEKLFDNWIQIFKDSSNVRDVKNFLSLARVKIKEEIGINLSEVSVVIAASKDVKFKTELISKRIHISGDSISKKDIENILFITNDSYSSLNRSIILSQPLLYKVEGTETKRYTQAPLNKKGEYLSGTFAVSTIDQKIYLYLENLFKSSGLKINKILTTTLTISQTNLSVGAREQGAVLINFGSANSFVSINKNGATIESLELYDVGLKYLIENISRKLSITLAEAKELLYLYGSLSDEKRVIYSRASSVNTKVIYHLQLSTVIKEYFFRIFAIVDKFMKQKQIASLPVVLSGKISPFENMESVGRKIFKSFSKHRPMSFIENQTENKHINGLITLNSKLEKMSGVSLDTIIETMPGEYKSIKLTKKHRKTFASKFIKMIGGQYEWDK